ncbi:putative toxin-antitoxin system toxin component, PIN family [Rhodothermaceae bacterium RA]|nr:putative toxin-antitoxin system toxin component, PIN family [Rhodothermaceae bacterium RA]
MSDRPRYVFDTNTIVSAFLFDESFPGRALKMALRRGTVLLSEEVAEELSGVLRRERFDRYVRRERREELLYGLIREATLVEVRVTIRACRDAADDKFLALAVEGNAACIVTGDADLLVLHPFRNIPVLNAHAFLEWVRR